MYTVYIAKVESRALHPLHALKGSVLGTGWLFCELACDNAFQGTTGSVGFGLCSAAAVWVLPPIVAHACMLCLRFGGQFRSGRWGTASCSSTCATVRAGVCACW